MFLSLVKLAVVKDFDKIRYKRFRLQDSDQLQEAVVEVLVTSAL